MAALAAQTAAMLAAAASSAAAAQMAASEFTIHLQATIQALVAIVATHVPCASHSQDNHLIEEILATPSHQEKTAPVMAVHMKSLSTTAPPLIIENQGSSPIIMDQRLLLSDASHIADARHFIGDTPQGKLLVKIPHLFKAPKLQGGGGPRQNTSNISQLIQCLCPQKLSFWKATNWQRQPLLQGDALQTSSPLVCSHCTLVPRQSTFLSKSGKLCSCNSTIVIKEWEITFFFHHYVPNKHLYTPAKLCKTTL